MRPLKRILIDMDLAYINSLVQQELVDKMEWRRRQDKAHGISDQFFYMCQQSLIDDEHPRYVYKVMMLLLWANVNDAFRSYLLEGEEFPQRITAKLRDMFINHCRGLRLDGRPYGKDPADIARHLRTTGHFVHTFQHAYLSQF